MTDTRPTVPPRAGYRYRTRGGEVVGPLMGHYNGFITELGDGNWWNSAGHHTLFNHLDLVEELPGASSDSWPGYCGRCKTSYEGNVHSCDLGGRRKETTYWGGGGGVSAPTSQPKPPEQPTVKVRLLAAVWKSGAMDTWAIADGAALFDYKGSWFAGEHRTVIADTIVEIPLLPARTWLDEMPIETLWRGLCALAAGAHLHVVDSWKTKARHSMLSWDDAIIRAGRDLGLLPTDKE